MKKFLSILAGAASLFFSAEAKASNIQEASQKDAVVNSIMERYSDSSNAIDHPCYHNQGSTNFTCDKVGVSKTCDKVGASVSLTCYKGN